MLATALASVGASAGLCTHRFCAQALSSSRYWRRSMNLSSDSTIFWFVNQKMVESLLKFIERRQYRDEDKAWAQNLWVHKPAEAPTLANAVASMVGAGEFWHTWGVLRGYPHLQPYAMHTVT